MTADAGFPVQPPGNRRGSGGTLDDATNIGGAGGSMGLAGANNLQQSIDTLNTTIINLIQSIANASFNKPQNTQGSAGSQQTTGNGGGFPGMTNAAFGVVHGLFGGIGAGNVPASSSMGGGNAGSPNVSQPQGQGSGAGFVQTAVKAGGIAAAVGAIADFGQAQMPGQIALNQNAAATFSMMPAGSTFSQAQNLAAANSVGTMRAPIIGPVNLADAAQGNANLQSLAGSANYNMTPLGTAGVAATSAAMVASGFSMNQAQATGSAMNLYGRPLSMALMQMGRGQQSPLNASTGLPQGNPAQIAQSLSLMINKPSTPGFDAKTGTLSPTAFNKAFGANTIGMQDLQNINAMSGNALGNVNDYIAQMRDYNNLMHGMGKGAPALSANQANTLINQDVRGTTSQQNAAKATLQKYGIAPTDIQALKANTAQTNVRGGMESKGFTEGLNTAADGLTRFNAALNKLLGADGGLGANALGYGKGMAGTLTGSGHGGIPGMIGDYIIGKKALGLGKGLSGKVGKNFFSKAGTAADDAAAKAGRVASSAAGDVGKSGTALGDIGSFLGESLGIAGMALPLISGKNRAQMHKYASKNDPGKGGVWNPFNWVGAYANQTATGIESIFGGAATPVNTRMDWNTPPAPVRDPDKSGSKFPGMTQNVSGGAAVGNHPPKSNSKVTKKPAARALQTISAQAKRAVGAAEQEIGVSYLWAGETPGVGFDCSGLTQWAYKQAGVNLPRTSQQQWGALSKRAVPLNEVEEGDLVFMGGSDGSADAPGHVGMMINQSHLVQAPYTGAKVQIIGYNPHQWSHAARPTGSVKGKTGPVGGTGSGGKNGSGTNPGGPASGIPSTMQSGMGGGGTGNFTSEADAVASALGGGGDMSGGLGIGMGLNTMPGSGSGGSGGGGVNPGGPMGKPGAVTKGLSGNKQIMNTQAAKYGWGTGSQWNALNTLEMHEAGYRNNAQNPGSTAYGMGQFLDTTWADVGGHKTSDPTIQAQDMLKYIKQRYGNPAKAWAQYYAHPGGIGWYSEGTNAAKPGLAWVGERGPELIKNKGGEQIFSNAQSMATMKAAQVRPAQSPWGVPTEMSNSGLTISKGNQPQNCQTTVNIGSGAIQVNMPPGTGGDITQAGQAIAKSMMRYLSNENLHATIMRGHKL